jgi:hypothetical protein
VSKKTRGHVTTKKGKIQRQYPLQWDQSGFLFEKLLDTLITLMLLSFAFAGPDKPPFLHCKNNDDLLILAFQRELGASSSSQVGDLESFK